MDRRNWERSELILVLALYCRLPFGKYHSRNSEIEKLAEIIGRSSNAVAMKLSNFASFDPYHQSRGVMGLQNAGRTDREIWDEFMTELDPNLSLDSKSVVGTIDFSGVTELERMVKVRSAQHLFRNAVLTDYENKCCVCGMPMRELLVASHIVAWSESESLRVNPHNGLCLCALHDKGFDRGLFTVGENYAVVIGEKIKHFLPNSALHIGFVIYDGKIITMPNKYTQKQEYFALHRDLHFPGS